MPTQTIKSIQQLFDGDATAGVPNFGWRNMSLQSFDKTHANDPDVGVFNSNWDAHEWPFNQDRELHFWWTAPSDRIDNTDVYFQWHFSTNDVTSGNVFFRLFRSFANIGSNFNAGSSQLKTVTVDTAFQHYSVLFGAYQDSITINGTYVLRAERLGANASDTYPDSIFTFDFQVWYQSDRIGTPNHLPPFFS